MGSKFSKDDAVIINDSAEVAFKHRGETATVVDTFVFGAGQTTPAEYDNKCLVTIQFDDGTIMENVPESELDAI